MKKFTDDQEKDIIKDLISKKVLELSMPFKVDVQTNMFSFESDGKPGQNLYVFLYYPTNIESVTAALKDLTKLNNMIVKTFGKFLSAGTIMSKDENASSGQLGFGSNQSKVTSSFRYMIEFTDFKNESDVWKAYKGIEKFDL